MARFVENVDQVIANIKTLEGYLNSDVPEDRDFARDLVKKGRAMVVYKVNGQNHFAPARFVGFVSNSRTIHMSNESKEIRDPAPSLQSILGHSFTTDAIEKEFGSYASNFKGNTLKSKRKYWRVRDSNNKYYEMETKSVEEPETLG